MLFNLAQTLRSFDHITGVDDGDQAHRMDAPTGICAPRRGVEFATEGSRPFSDLLPGAAELAEPVISSSGWVAEFSRRCATASDG